MSEFAGRVKDSKRFTFGTVATCEVRLAMIQVEAYSVQEVDDSPLEPATIIDILRKCALPGGTDGCNKPTNFAVNIIEVRGNQVEEIACTVVVAQMP